MKRIGFARAAAVGAGVVLVLGASAGVASAHHEHSDEHEGACASHSSSWTVPNWQWPGLQFDDEHSGSGGDVGGATSFSSDGFGGFTADQFGCTGL